MSKSVKDYPWWLWFLAEIIVFIVTSAFAYRLTSKPEFSFTWGLSAVVITICFNIVAEQKQFTARMDKLAEVLPHDVVKHSAYQALLMSETFLAIHHGGDEIFINIAANEISNVSSVLRCLKNGEYKITGDNVYLIYESLIESLIRDEAYKATCYIDDVFWETDGGKAFLNCNVEAVRRGACITRIFFYRRLTDEEVKDYEVTRMHLKAKSHLTPDEQTRFELRTLDITDRAVRDMGILKDKYFMQITSDVRNRQIDASVSTDQNTVRNAKDDWAAVYKLSRRL